MTAIEYGNLEIINLFEEKGFNQNVKEAMFVATYNKDIDVMKHLFEKGYDVN